MAVDRLAPWAVLCPSFHYLPSLVLPEFVSYLHLNPLTTKTRILFHAFSTGLSWWSRIVQFAFVRRGFLRSKPVHGYRPAIHPIYPKVQHVLVRYSENRCVSLLLIPTLVMYIVNRIGGVLLICFLPSVQDLGTLKRLVSFSNCGSCLLLLHKWVDHESTRLFDPCHMYMGWRKSCRAKRGRERICKSERRPASFRIFSSWVFAL